MVGTNIQLEFLLGGDGGVRNQQQDRIIHSNSYRRPGLIPRFLRYRTRVLQISLILPYELSTFDSKGWLEGPYLNRKQLIFDFCFFLSQTLPSQWEREAVRVMTTVFIHSRRSCL